MKKIVNKDNTINYGSYDESLEFNSQDFVLHNFWDKPVGWFKQKLGFHKFHFVSLNNNESVVCFAIVDVGIAMNTFGYVYDKNNNKVIETWSFGTKGKEENFTNDVNHSVVNIDTGKFKCQIDKDLINNKMVGSYEISEIINISYEADFSFENKPLRVVNPADFDHWVFTEKRAGLKINKLNVILKNQIINMTPSNTLCSIDWSGGFFKRDTTWIWSSCSFFDGNNNVGFNFVNFHNNTLFPENAIWFNNERQTYDLIKFKWNYSDPYNNPMSVYTEDNKINLTFKPLGQKDDVESRGAGLIKTNFHQYFGIYNGHITCNNQTINVNNILGLFEIHKAKW